MYPKLLLAYHDQFGEALAIKLRQKEMTVFTPANDEEFLDMLSNREVNVILLDVRGHGDDVFQKLALVRDIQPAAEVIVLSDAKSIGRSMDCMLEGAVDDITVPFDVDTLEKKIQTVWKNQQAKRN